MEILFSLRYNQYIAQMSKVIKYKNSENKGRIPHETYWTVSNLYIK